jgi:hypothetical protein
MENKIVILTDPALMSLIPTVQERICPNGEVRVTC